jgi:flagellar biosynthetic protein FlhB
MPEYNGEKTHDPTPHRRQQAREKGQVAYSGDLSSAIVLLGSTLVLLYWGGDLLQSLVDLMKFHLAGDGPLPADPATAASNFHLVLQGLARTGLPILLLLMLVAVLASLVQTGFLFVPERAMPDFARISLIRGVQRIFSLAGVVRLGFGLFKVLVVFVVAGAVLYARRAELIRLADYDLAAIGFILLDVSLKTALWVGAALLVLALFDYGWQRMRHEKDLRMTHQEVREEMKNLQGDPQIIARRRAIQRQMVASRISSAVPKADVVVTNPTELAVAIQYDPATMAAPIVVAKGAGVLAQRIRRLALEHNIPIVEKKELARLLYKEVEINHPVPDKSYAAVAEVLAYVYQLKGKTIPGAA